MYGTNILSVQQFTKLHETALVFNKCVWKLGLIKHFEYYTEFLSVK